MEQRAPDFTLLPDPPKQSEVYGFRVGDSPAQVMESLRSMRLNMREFEKNNERISIMHLDSLPPALSFSDGKSELWFQDGQLVHLKFNLEPSYENFLVMKDKVVRSLGQRFTLSEARENMDRYLRSHLSQLKKNEFDDRSERAISSAMTRGSTFFFYRFGDVNQELDVRFAYRKPESEGRPPRLCLSFSVEKAIEAYRQELKEQRSEQALLPGE